MTGAVKLADVVFEVITFDISRTNVKGSVIETVKPKDIIKEALTSGVRWIGIPNDIQTISYFNLEVAESARRKAIEYSKMLSNASTFKIFSNGEELKGKLGRKCYPLSYIAEPPHNSAYWGLAGEAMMAPMEGSTNGSFIVRAVVGMGILEENLKIVVKNGILEDAEGEEGSRFLQIVQEADENAKILCELGVGTNSKCRLEGAWSVHEIKEGEGRIHIAFGHNRNFAGGHPDYAGNVDSIMHMDTVILEPTLELDGTTVIANGKLLFP